MYDWRLYCRERTSEFALEQGIELAAKDFGHLEHFHYGSENVCLDIVETLNIGGGERLLDAGCGIGGSARTLSRLGKSVVGVDANAAFIAYADENSRDGLCFHQSRLEEVGDLEYDAWFALLVFVHIDDRQTLFEKLESDCRHRGRFFLETIVSHSTKQYFDGPLWTDAEVKRLTSDVQIIVQSSMWKAWTELRLERFLERRAFFEDLYGKTIVNKRMHHYEKIAEGFQSGVLEGRRVVGPTYPASQIETQLEKTCIIEFDQFSEIV